MRFIDKKQKLNYLLELIRKGNTGIAKDMAERLFISVPTLEKYIAILREDGHKIGYCTQRKTYYLFEDKNTNLWSSV